VILALASAVALPPTLADSGPIHAKAETQLVSALRDMRDGQFDGAMSNLSSLVDKRPDFRLAHYLYGELMFARAGRISELMGPGDDDARRHALIEEAKFRWRHRSQAAPQGGYPRSVLKLASRYRHVVVADLNRHRLFLLRNENGRPRLIADFYASIGQRGAGKQEEGDKRTPIGVYHVTEYKDDGELPELYGDGAFPVSYPNKLDQLYGRTGYGIWVHGVPRDTYSRAPRASEGCVVVANEDLQVLKQYLRPGITPVVFTDDMAWLEAGQAEDKRTEVLDAVQGWRSSWESLATERYLGYYSDDFVSDDGMSKEAFADYKRQVNANKKRVDIELSEISVFAYPNAREMALVSFTQRYSSQRFNATVRKQQFWRKDSGSGDWQIIHEALEE